MRATRSISQAMPIARLRHGSSLAGLLWLLALVPAAAQHEGYVGDAVCLDCHEDEVGEFL